MLTFRDYLKSRQSDLHTVLRDRLLPDEKVQLNFEVEQYVAMRLQEQAEAKKDFPVTPYDGMR